MRIDKFLKVSRLIKRRTLANEVADAGRISVNGRQVKASYAVKVGDEMEIAFGQKPVRVKFVSVDAPAGKDVARGVYSGCADGAARRWV
ncbi:MAG: RNA-binding S4 domain-containing protein, partial [Ruthenibacterium sp.]